MSLSVFGCFLSACSDTEIAQKAVRTEQGTQPQIAIPEEVPKPQPLPVPTQASKARDLGDFKLVYASVEKPEYQNLEQVFKTSGQIDSLVAGLNKTLALPTDITIRMTDGSNCSKSGTHYRLSQKEIVLCYQDASRYAQEFSKHLKSEAEIATAVLDVSSWDLLHETGHALISVLQLPITGREEDVADEIATLKLIEAGNGWDQAAMNAAKEFAYTAQQQSSTKELWDVHALDQQRSYNILCFVYGSNPKKHASLVQKGTLPEARANTCVDEYAQKTASWNTLLSAYLKNQARPITTPKS
ncbi:DUF4344 domain-containing metallopeptidase [Leptolyngbya sp. FACHB-261]|uniref:DUF4344 domain-containing metallopeptidase n=1 Tax=Leptolyngbya sp. FACHB-261 TaxID=2692806 RepID=UPI00168225B8|nr:DUF4344 domain-containing metallopeptidase [Leptolyngbya sp. FACHB-261]